METAPGGAAETTRLDRWLWAARVYKTRSLAANACDAGHVKVNGERAKPAKAVRRGDRVEAVTPGGERLLELLGVDDKRGPASAARSLYVDHTPPPPAEDASLPRRDRGAGRPTKRDRRILSRVRAHDDRD